MAIWWADTWMLVSGLEFLRCVEFTKPSGLDGVQTRGRTGFQLESWSGS